MEKPKIGSWIEVETDYSAYKKNFRQGIDRRFTTTGRVVESNDWEGENTFALLTTDPKMLIKTINMDFVTSIRVTDGATVRAADAHFDKITTQADSTETKVFQIPASKGDKFYEVKKIKFNWSCSCEAGQRGRFCKHVKAAKEMEAKTA